MHPERRKRHSIRTEVTINHGTKAEGLDLNELGMYIYTPNHVIPNSIVPVTFELGGREFELSTQVTHTQPGVGMGVKFLDISEQEQQFIKDYIARHASGEDS